MFRKLIIGAILMAPLFLVGANAGTDPHTERATFA
jgi:hypothetical protein